MILVEVTDQATTRLVRLDGTEVLPGDTIMIPESCWLKLQERPGFVIPNDQPPEPEPEPEIEPLPELDSD